MEVDEDDALKEERSNESFPDVVDSEGNYDRASVTLFPKKEHYGTDGKRFCAHGGNVCTQRPMRNFDFCVKHILQDPKAPFKQCDYIAKQTNKQCANPVKIVDPKDDNRYCNAHKQMLGIIPKGTGQYSKKKKGASTDKNKASDTPPGKRKKEGEEEEEVEEEVNSDTETDDGVPTDSTKPKAKKKRKTRKTSSAVTVPIGNGQYSATISTGDSDTESDVATDEEGFYDEEELIFELDGKPRFTQEEFLLARRARIERMIKIYQSQQNRMKQSLQVKYQQFIKQRQQATNGLLSAKMGQGSTVKLRMKVADHEQEDEQMTLRKLLEAVVTFPAENRQVYQVDKEEKYDELTKEPLCSHPECHSHRMMCSEFCFTHILYDRNQRLYMAGPNGPTDPVLCYRMLNGNAVALLNSHSERKVVVLESSDKVNTTDAEADKRIDYDKLTKSLSKIKE
ncbi:INO80 complex subunit D [Acrasis kona]|uniref:INO80 complex subunit D n=1 Tax=Acrasis kona TaxID=1008807 RepID=A0AAW2ZML4_9EUKA